MTTDSDFSGMDTPVRRRSRLWSRRTAIIGACVAAVAGAAIWVALRDSAPTMTVDRESITIATARRGEFNDYIRIVGHVTPASIIYLDAVEGGRVDEKLIEEGSQVKAGDVILRLSNTQLNIGILQSESNLAYQENELRNTRLNLEQEHLRLEQERIGLQKELTRKQRRAEQCTRLYDKGLIAREEYLTAVEESLAAGRNMSVLSERIRQDSLLRASQLKSLDDNIDNMRRSLQLVRRRLEDLNITAPADGVLGDIDAQIGQSIARGERIGQIITPELKVEAGVDEHYVERVIPGLHATLEREGQSFEMVISKVYPEVREGRFRVDLRFCDTRPDNLRAGQTCHLDLRLGDPSTAIIIPRGSFSHAGGTHIYVIDPTGRSARLRPVRLGRQNPLYYEVLEGLADGERIIISDYALFGNNERLNIKI